MPKGRAATFLHMAAAFTHRIALQSSSARRALAATATRLKSGLSLPSPACLRRSSLYETAVSLRQRRRNPDPAELRHTSPPRPQTCLPCGDHRSRGRSQPPSGGNAAPARWDNRCGRGSSPEPGRATALLWVRRAAPDPRAACAASRRWLILSVAGHRHGAERPISETD